MQFLTSQVAFGIRLAGLAAVTAFAIANAVPAQARAATGCDDADAQAAALTRDQAAAAIGCLINQERRRRDLGALREHPRLEQAAERHARDMVRRRYFSHTTPEGVSMADRLRAVGYVRDAWTWSVGEVLAWGTSGRATPAAIVAGWLDSPSHRRVLLSAGYRDVGIGLALGVPLGGFAGRPGATFAAELGARS